MSRFDKDSLGNRMKTYEEVYKQRTVPKEAIVLRIDGNSFHTFTKGMKKPFDDLLIETMQQTLLALCKDIPNSVFGYTQSDEITIVTIPTDIIRSEDYYSGKVQKILSVTASKTTKFFNRFFYENVQKLKDGKFNKPEVVDASIYEKRLFEAAFDCRVMNIPEFDIYNNLIWRQQDAIRNSIQMLGQANFSHAQLQKKNTGEIQDMLIEKGINWNNLETYKKQGSCCYKIDRNETHKQWFLDNDMYSLTSQEGRDKYQKIVERNYAKKIDEIIKDCTETNSLKNEINEEIIK